MEIAHYLQPFFLYISTYISYIIHVPFYIIFSFIAAEKNIYMLHVRYSSVITLENRREERKKFVQKNLRLQQRQQHEHISAIKKSSKSEKQNSYFFIYIFCSGGCCFWIMALYFFLAVVRGEVLMFDSIG